MRKSFLLLIISLLLIAWDSLTYVTQGKSDVINSSETSFIEKFNSVSDSIPESIRNTKAYKRLEWFYGSRLDEKGNYPKEHIEQERILEEIKIQNRKIKSGDNPKSDLWSNIGPLGIDMASSGLGSIWGVVSGRVRGLAVHPTNSNIVYIGAAAGGIWKSTNGGVNWTDKSGEMNRVTFGAIAIDKNNPNTIYAGTGESMLYWNYTTFEGDGLYKSVNGGDNWTKITNGFGTMTQFADIEVSPVNSNIILAALGSGNINNMNPTNRGIWRSTDAGLTWNMVMNSTGAFDVAFHPTNGNLAYASIGRNQSTGGFYISTDAGETWTQSNSGLPTYDLIGRIQFEISQSNPSILYCIIFNSTVISSGERTCVYKSTNAGAAWSQIDVGFNFSGDPSRDQGSYDLCLGVSPTNPNIAFFGNIELSKTTNGSRMSLVRYGNGNNAISYTHVDIHRIRFAPSNSNIIYVGCDGGIYCSTDGGSTFSHRNNGINTIQFYRLASHPTNPSILFGGAQDNGTFSTSNKGATNWTYETSGDGMECFIDYSNGNNIFMSIQNGYLFKSVNGGSNWTFVRVSTAATSAWCSPYWQHPTQPLIIYAAVERKIFRSLDGGATITEISPVITTTNNITSVAQSPVNTNYMIAVASRYNLQEVYKSSDEGITWTDISANVITNFTGCNIQRVEADPVSANTFYLCRASYTTGQVIKTTDFGTTWLDISAGLPGISANDIFVDPAKTNQLYVANDFGVYWTSGEKAGWTKLNNGMPFVPVLDFSFYHNGTTRFLRAASHGRGIYDLSIDVPLPVVLESFACSVSNRDVFLNWTTASENNNAGFEIERTVASSTGLGEWIKVGYVTGNGTKTTPTNYIFDDKKLNTSKYNYRLKQIDYNGNFEYHNLPSVVEVGVPNKYAMSQNYPNPFNPTTKIDFDLPYDSRVSIKLYDISGREVMTLVNEQKQAGYYTIQMSGNNLSSGVYFYKITVGNFSAVKKMLMIK